jgi:hypothetical protein
MSFSFVLYVAHMVMQVGQRINKGALEGFDRLLFVKVDHLKMAAFHKARVFAQHLDCGFRGARNIRNFCDAAIPKRPKSAK